MRDFMKYVISEVLTSTGNGLGDAEDGKRSWSSSSSRRSLLNWRRFGLVGLMVVDLEWKEKVATLSRSHGKWSPRIRSSTTNFDSKAVLAITSTNGWKELLHPNLPTTQNRCAGALRDFGDLCSYLLDGRRCSGLPLCRAWILFLHFSSPTTRLRMRPSYLLEKFIILEEIYCLFREYHKIELFKILRNYNRETINKTLTTQVFLPQISNHGELR